MRKGIDSVEPIQIFEEAPYPQKLALDRLGVLYEALVTVLKQKNLISADDLAKAIERARVVDL